MRELCCEGCADCIAAKTRVKDLEGKLGSALEQIAIDGDTINALKGRAESAEADWQHVEQKWQQAKDLLRALVIALQSGASTDEILETINRGAGITVPSE